MNEPNKSDNSSFNFPGAAVVALLVGIFVFKDIALESSRPLMKDTDRISSEDVRSRLWQDPFEAVVVHRKKYAEQTGQTVLSIVDSKDQREFRISHERTQTTVVQLDDDEKAIQSGNPPQIICNSAKNSSTSDIAKAHTIEELRCQIRRDAAANPEATKNPLHVLAVMVPGGPYANDREARLRHRYALVSGLISSGYKPKDAEHIGFVDFAGACNKALQEKDLTSIQEEESRLCKMPPIMPYEWFESKYKDTPNGHAPQKILVLWLNNDAFRKEPLWNLYILNELIKPVSVPLPRHKFQKDKKSSENALIEFRLQIIGPYDSVTYEKLDCDLRDQPSEKQKCVVSERDIKRNHYAKHSLEKNLILSPFATIDVDENQQAENENSLDRIRTIATNKNSMLALNCELILRGVDIFKSKDHRRRFFNQSCGSQITEKHIPFGRSFDDQKHHVVLIGEKDTRYSRELTKSFAQSMTNLEDKDIQNQIHTFSYLRGIDGVKGGANQNNDDESRKDDRKPGESSAPKNITKIHRPEDAYQFDYVRRLAGRLERLQQELSKREVKGEIKAIGILGSDPYDKLLILQALHKKFPQVIFFTTDLDARLLHPDQAPWTRNLIVASSYGLELHDDLQQGAPPFRDNYQTALYLTTQFAALCRKESNEIACENPSGWNKERSLQEIFDSINVKFNPKDVSNKVSPSRLFEIGNHGAVDISLVSGDGIHPAVMPDSIQLPHFVLLMLFLIVLTILLKEFVPRKKLPIIVVIMTGLFIVAALFGLLRVSGTEWMMFVYLLFFLGTLALILYYLLQDKPRKIVICIIVGSVSLVAVFLIFSEVQSLDTFSFNDGISTWPANAIRSFAIVMALGFCYLGYVQLRKYQTEIEKDFGFDQAARDKKTLGRFERRAKADIPQQKFNIDDWGNLPGDKPVLKITNLWHGLDWMMSCSHGFRVLVMLMLYAVCVVLLLLTGFIEMPGIPARGRVDFFVTQAVLFLLVLAYLVLIFIIADITHLASRLIGLLKSNDYHWPSAKLGEYCERYGSTELARQKLKIDLIHRIAKEINGFVYYPFVILFLLILSRSHFFDNWHYTPFLFFVFCFTAILALLSAARLRWAAIAARDKVLEAVQDRYWPLQSQGDVHKKCVRLLVDEIKSLDSGPFLPLSKHPVFLSVLLPLSSIGGLYLIEYMLTAS